MSKALTICSVPGCPEEVVRGKCKEHERKRRAARPKNTFYSSPKWQAIRRQYLDRHPVCEEPGCGAASTEVHHIDGNTDHNSYRNLKALCKPCHSRITLNPFQVRETIRSGRPHLQKQERPGFQEPVIGGGLVDVVRKRKQEEREASGDAVDASMDEGWPDVDLPPDPGQPF
jgi:5-methylcytosine-specific restriction enzyme A